LTTAPRIKPTSIFLRSARRPNPGRRSTYRRGIIVQTTGTGSDFPSNVHSIEEMLAYIGKKTGFNSATMFSQIAKDEGDRTAADYADANPLSEDEE
jgi:hypothetical protein